MNISKSISCSIKSLLFIAFALATVGCSRSTSQDGHSYEKRYVEAINLYEHGGQEKAIELLRKLVRDDPEDLRWKISLAIALIESAPLRNGFPVPKSSYDEPLRLIEDVKRTDEYSLSDVQKTDVELAYAIALSLSGRVEIGLNQFHNIFSNDDVLHSGIYNNALSSYAHDLVISGRENDALDILREYLDKRWSPLGAADYVRLLVSKDVDSGERQYLSMVSVHGDSGNSVKRGLCDGFEVANQVARSRQCFNSIVSDHHSDIVVKRYAQWRLSEIK